MRHLSGVLGEWRLEEMSPAQTANLLGMLEQLQRRLRTSGELLQSWSDGFRAALSISLNVHAQNVAPKLASAIYKAFERSGAAPDVVSRAEQGAVFAAHAHQRSFGV